MRNDKNANLFSTENSIIFQKPLFKTKERFLYQIISNERRKV